MSLSGVINGAADSLAATFGKTVIYSRGTAWAVITALAGRTDYEEETADGGLVRHQARDWIVKTADLVLASVEVLPQEGDMIAEIVGDKTATYRVLNVGGEGCYRYCDPTRTLLRVHTKQVSLA